MSLRFIFLTLLSFSSFAEEVCEIPGTPFQEIQDLMRASRDNCVELPKGSFRIQNSESGRAQHLMERDSNGNYRATFNIDFKAMSGVSTTPQFMKDKLNECLMNVAPYLKGPDGNTITMRILLPGEIRSLPDNQRPQKFKINISEVGARSNTRLFGPDDDCHTITHEMLHHLGLQDEYPEMDPTLATHWNCRPLTREDSVMYLHTRGLAAALPQTLECQCTSGACETLRSSPDEAVIRRLSEVPGWPMTPEFQREYCSPAYAYAPQGTVPTEGLRIASDSGDAFVAKYYSLHPDARASRYVATEMTLNCRCADETCLNKKREILSKIGKPSPTPNVCPSGMRESTRVLDRGRYNPGFHNGKFRFSTTPARSSILYPNQFKRAVAGKCEENIPGYGMCSEYAYTGSKNNQCKTPQECRNPDFYLGKTPQ